MSKRTGLPGLIRCILHKWYFLGPKIPSPNKYRRMYYCDRCGVSKNQGVTGPLLEWERRLIGHTPPALTKAARRGTLRRGAKGGYMRRINVISVFDVGYWWIGVGVIVFNGIHTTVGLGPWRVIITVDLT